MPPKRVNPRLAKLHRSYSVNELALLLGVHKHTVRGWIKSGLPTVDSSRPILILGSEFQAWWAKRKQAAKRPLGPRQFYCLKCRQSSAPALGMVEYTATNATTGNLKALCDTCGTMMHRRTRLASIGAIMPDLTIERRQAPSSIRERAQPCLNTDKPMEG